MIALNKKTLILYFHKDLYFFIQVYLDNQKCDLDLEKKVIKKVVNIKAKINLQPFLKIKEINFRYSKNYRLAKKDKDKVNQDY